jgi:shikimate dehydrogenase
MTADASPAARFALLGYPLTTTLSPPMHNSAYRALGWPHHYEALRCTETELPEVIARLREGEFDGYNVTMPHKRAVLSLVDEIAPSAQRAGAANTLVRMRDGDAVRLVAHNTDAPALLAELGVLRPRAELEGAAHLVLGAGGAARGAISVLAHDLRARRLHVRARAFGPTADGRAAMDKFRDELRVSLAGTSCELELSDMTPRTDDRAFTCILQCTSDGMGASDGLMAARAVAWDALHPEAIAFDMVYAPPQTAFLRAAAAKGLRHANGLGMLARQAAEALALWLEVPAPFEALRYALMQRA